MYHYYHITESKFDDVFTIISELYATFILFEKDEGEDSGL